MGAQQGKYPSYPCVDSDLQLVFLDPEAEGLPLNAKNLDRATDLSTKKLNAVPFYTADPEKLKRWRNIKGGSTSIFDFAKRR
jgi:hypothetical protein